MAGWEELSRTLAELSEQDPMPLRAWTGGGHYKAGPPAPPWAISLAPWAVDVARRLHEEYGSDVALTVGVLPYPAVAPEVFPRRDEVAATLDPGITVALEEPVTVASGHAVTATLLVGNDTAETAEFALGPWLLADVVDPETGAVVGGYAGVIDAVRHEYSVPPGGRTPIPLRVGTDSFDAARGHAVPPGRWGIAVTLHRITEQDLAGRAIRTPILPLTIT